MGNISPKGNLLFYILLIGISLLGILLSLYTTGEGIGLSPDSATYIGVARNIAKNFTIAEPLTQERPLTIFPPLLPLILALINLSGIDPLISFRGLNALLLGVNVFLVAFIIRISTRKFWPPILGSLIFLSQADIIIIHSIAWTEPLFLSLSLGGILLLAYYLESEKKKFLIFSALTLGGAFLTRYAGITLILTGSLGILFLRNKNLEENFKKILIFFTLSVIPVGIWIVRNLIIGGSAISKKLGFYPPFSGKIKFAGTVFLNWLSPPEIPLEIRITFYLFLLLYIFILFLSYLKIKNNNESSPHLFSLRILPLFGIFISTYLFLLILTILFLDAQLVPDFRILSPVFSFTLIALTSGISKLLCRIKNSKLLKGASIILSLLILNFYILHSIKWIIYAHNNGIGYSEKAWKDSEIIKEIKRIGTGALIYSNAPDLIYLLTGIPAQTIPRLMNPNTREPNKNFQTQILGMLRELKSKNGLLIYFSTINWRWYLPAEAEFRNSFKLQIFKKYEKGTIYKLGQK